MELHLAKSLPKTKQPTPSFIIGNSSFPRESPLIASQTGQGAPSELKERDFKRELEDRERKAKRKENDEPEGIFSFFSKISHFQKISESSNALKHLMQMRR